MKFIQGILAQAKTFERQTGKKVRFKRPTVQQYPRAAERSYAAALGEIVREAGKDILEEFLPQLDYLTRLAGIRSDGARADQEDISTIINTIVGKLKIKLDNQRLRDLSSLVEGYFNSTAEFSRAQTFRQIRRAIGVDAMAPEPQLLMMLESWRDESVSLITRVTQNQIDDVADIVRRQVRQGNRPGLIGEAIQERLGISERRARFIARDQTAKLNGQLTQMRQSNLGIEEYIWRTSRDERVRASHLEKEGQKFRWDSPPFDTGHPGQDYNCRCTAEPVIPGMPAPKEDRQKVIAEVKEKKKAMQERLAAQKERKRKR